MSRYLTSRNEYKPFSFTVRTDEDSGDGLGNNPSGPSQYKLPFILGAQYRCVVDWGDGNTDLITSYDQILDGETIEITMVLT